MELETIISEKIEEALTDIPCLSYCQAQAIVDHTIDYYGLIRLLDMIYDGSLNFNEYHCEDYLSVFYCFNKEVSIVVNRGGYKDYFETPYTSYNDGDVGFDVYELKIMTLPPEYR